MLGLWLALPGVARAEPPLHTPWPCGVTYEITQGHNTGSHTDEGSWAWDIGLPVGADVSAPADGVVRLVKMDSTVGGCSSSYANDANYVVLDFGDGSEALFLHLQAGSSPFSVGDLVKQGDVVGRVGLTGWVCGAHLHFQIQQTCASWWCQSFASSFIDFGDPVDGTQLTSNNCPLLEGCGALDGGETVIDEQTTCFTRETSYWWNVAEGYEDHHFYTFATDAAEHDTRGRYTFDVTVAGEYEVRVFVPDTEADTTNASYTLDAGAGPTVLGSIDQSVQKGWISIGSVSFSEGVERYLELGDATGESPDLDRKIAFDAVSFSYLPSGEGAGGPGGGSEGGSGPIGGGAAEGGSSNEAGGPGSSDDDETSDDGCSCRSSAGSVSPAGGALGIAIGGLVAAAARRRRRRHR